MSDEEYNLLELESPDGDDTFTLKVNGEITTEIEKDIISDTLSDNAREIIGTSINVNRRTRTLRCVIANMDEDDYPNRAHDAEDYTNHNHAYAIEIEFASDNWGTFIVSDMEFKNSTLRWNRGGIEQEFNGYLSNVTTSLIPSDTSSNADQYDLTIEFTEIDRVYE